MTTRNPSRYSDAEAARRGDEIYERDIRAQVEQEHDGKIVAIDIETGDFAVDETVLAASERLLDRHPNADIWSVRVGRRSLRRIG